MSFVVSVLGLALAAAPASDTSDTQAPGTVLLSAPSVPPGRVAPLPADLLQAAIDRRTQGDNPAAAWYYSAWLNQRGGSARTRAAVELALGLTLLDLDEPNLASAHFSKVRASGTPVAPWGAWYEAYADHLRGRHSVAARECQAYRTAWPDGEHADECLVLIGDARVAAGERGSAIAAYNAYLEKHPDTPREETLRLGIALAVTNGSPAQGIPMLQNLLLDHAYHSTGETAQARLDALAEDGVATALPDTVATECRFAAERKRCGYETEAWEKFQSLAARAPENPELAEWVDAQQERFAWSTKQYDIVAAQLAEQYAKKPDAETAWQRYRALARGGQWAEAVDQLQAGQKAHGSSGRFRSVRVEVARGQLLAGRYAEAVVSFTELGKSGGAFGNEARWLAAYAAFRAGTFEDAMKRLDAIVASKSDDHEMASRYYRSRTLDALGRAAEAEAERDEIRTREPMSWYAALTRGLGNGGLGNGRLGNEGLAVGGPDTWTARDGRWPGPPSPTLPALRRVGTGGVPVAVLASSSPTVDRTRAADWSALAWNPAPSTTAGTAIASVPVPSSVVPLHEVPPVPLSPRYEARPDAYRPSFLYDPAAADKLLATLAEEHGTALPWAAAAADLARAGVYRHSAPLMARMYDAVEAAQAAPSASDPVSLSLRAVSFNVSEWRNIFLFTRDDHHAARFSWGATKLAANEDQRLQALRYAFPTAQVNALYRHGARYGVDPLLALGLMRQESVYRQWALSPVGAIGLMQVMPRTGARVAALMGDPHYSPEQLEDPSTNVRYGVWYLSRLLDRFGGAFPLAVASYNGGPHNVSSWLRPWGSNIRVDDYVEQIPYTETRDYVKKVTGYYVTYLALYGPPGARVVVPEKVSKDDSVVINF